ncbi:hypothetical protein Taro_034689 [Colocasia esculenta]|uniref:EamA domain-containing protein n=1 Tax=Colocasia esculenta TaxID=4460 RepID=A0A843VYF1_COLES|nr:hypothetical protein [Colocasia esculenta]
MQDIFTDYKQPFAVTYLGASLMVVYLPIAILKDWLCNIFRKCSSKSGKNAEQTAQKMLEMQSQSPLIRKDSEIGLSSQEEGTSFIPKHRDVVDSVKVKREVTARQIALYGFYLAPIWFITETSVASTTVLSSTSGLFTLFIGVLMGQDSLNIAKVVAVFISMAGVAMTALGKTWATDEAQLSSATIGKRSLIGDIFSLLSAMSYGLFTVLLKKFAGEEGEGADVQKLFGYVGLFTLVALWWLCKLTQKIFCHFFFPLLKLSSKAPSVHFFPFEKCVPFLLASSASFALGYFCA